jgi:uncharacterized surface protein with fasciclin (FAS1) repeats
MNRKLLLAATTATMLITSVAPAQKFVRPRKKAPEPVASVGRVTMETPVEAPTTSIAQALPALADHATLARLVTAANLESTFAGPGPYTLFAPADAAFARMPAGAIDALLKPENQAALATVVKYHAIPGRVTFEELKAQIAAGNGTATLTTVSGQPVTASMLENGTVLLTDVNGGKSYVEKVDLPQTNGIVHLVNGVIIPKIG